jgi:hypothetical protein
LSVARYRAVIFAAAGQLAEPFGKMIAILRTTDEAQTVATRTTETTITFRRPFSLTEIDGLQPAGTYRVVTDEEEILGLSFLALRRTATMLHTPAVSTSSNGRTQVFLVDPAELAAALEEDIRT